eukprot:gene31848-41331_t
MGVKRLITGAEGGRTTDRGGAGSGWGRSSSLLAYLLWYDSAFTLFPKLENQFLVVPQAWLRAFR